MGNLRFVYDDGGRKLAGFRGEAGDCACRALAIVTGRPYREVYEAINEEAKGERFRRGRLGFAAATGRGSSARLRVYRETFKALAERYGLVWTPCMGIGTGCRVHVRAGELPATGRYILSLSRHFAAWVDGELRDTHDCSREGTRCVYGYWRLA